MTPEEIRRCKMIGDVNLFLPDGLAGQGECEIMIASKDDRRKGYAVEALQLFLRHLAQHLPLDPLQLIVKIASANIPSIKLFQTLGFGIVKHVKVFDEVEMHYAKPDDADILADLNLDSKRPARDGPKAIWEEIDLQGRIGMYYP
nr:uncharacterized protein I303_00331 [Kwoniella dejecticola CBS 10117]OBR88514.1 hypothetical protein I303_00331 [Kwoniella dejecticola CBS 10117]